MSMYALARNAAGDVEMLVYEGDCARCGRSGELVPPRRCKRCASKRMTRMAVKTKVLLRRNHE